MLISCHGVTHCVSWFVSWCNCCPIRPHEQTRVGSHTPTLILCCTRSCVSGHLFVWALKLIGLFVHQDARCFFASLCIKNHVCSGNYKASQGYGILSFKIKHAKAYLLYPCEPVLSSTGLDTSSYPWICWLRHCDQLLWQQFSVTPHVTKHLELCPLAKLQYWEPASTINNKWMMRLRTRLGARASLWFHLHLPVLITLCCFSRPRSTFQEGLFNLPKAQRLSEHKRHRL